MKSRFTNKPFIAKVSPLAIATALVFSTPAVAQEFSQTIFFGDSLSDTGRIKEIVTSADSKLGGMLQESFTTNPNPAWTRVLAGLYGTSAEAYTADNPQGTNFTVGAAQSGKTAEWRGVPIPSTATQIATYSDNVANGTADPSALYAVWIGANDLFAAAQATSLVNAQASIVHSVGATAKDINTLHEMGAKYILVPNIPDLSLTPLVQGLGNTVSAKTAVQLYNNGLFSALNQSSANVIPADTFTLLQEAVANAEAFGFSNVTGVACPNVAGIPATSSSLVCTTAAMNNPDDAETYLFADAIHPAGKTHRILAQYYRTIIDSPSQMGKLPSHLITDGKYSHDQLHRKLNQLDERRHSLWADVSVSDKQSANTMLGLDVAGLNHHTGAYIQHGSQNHRLSDTIGSDTKQTGFGLYHRYDMGALRVTADVGFDKLDIDTNRTVAWEGVPRSHTASTTGKRTHASVQGSFGIQAGNASVRPYVGVMHQKVKLDALTESAPTLSTAMSFGEQSRTSLVGELGVNAELPIKENVQLFGGVGYQHEFKDDDQAINARLTSISNYTRGFSMPVATDKDHRTTAHLGAKMTLAKASVNVGINASHQDSGSDVGGFVGVQAKF